MVVQAQRLGAKQETKRKEETRIVFYERAHRLRRVCQRVGEIRINNQTRERVVNRVKNAFESAESLSVQRLGILS